MLCVASQFTIRTECFHLPDICQVPSLYQHGCPGEKDMKEYRFELDSPLTLGNSLGNQHTGMCSVNRRALHNGKPLPFPVAQPVVIL